MKIAVIGHGNVGGTLAQKWAKASHQIVIGARNLQDERLKVLKNNFGIESSTIAQAVVASETIVVATPPQVALELVKEFGNVAGKVIVDATNAISAKPDPYPTAFHSFEALTEAKVVKCFNSTGYENMLNPRYGDIALTMLMAGDWNCCICPDSKLSENT